MKATALYGSAALALLGTALVTSTPAPTSSAADCVSKSSSARVTKGSKVAEPNAVTAAQMRAMEAATQRRLASLGHASAPKTLDPGSVTVPVRVHVLMKTDGTGNVSNTRINDQIQVLNDAYSGAAASAASDTPFRFAVSSIDRTKNNDWYNWGTTDADFESDDQQAKSALHKGGYDDLNIYIAKLGGGLLGYATFPGGPLKRDGAVLLNASLPGGSAAPYNLGDTATHEVGHWLGLYHTFENGCAKPGDTVADTPYQDDGDNIFACSAQDSCPAKAGNDPVKNFMNYVDDACMDRFTDGQSSRMSNQWVAWRDPSNLT
jgi:hypothetical protein